MTDLEPSPQPARAQPVGSFPNAWTLFRVRGIPVRMSWTWLLMAAFITYQLYEGFSQSSTLDATPLLPLLLAVTGALLFFASILAHELGHALTSLDRNIPVLSITLFALGGVTESTREADRARDEFVIVGIGPFISFVLAAAFGILWTVSTAPAVVALAGVLAFGNLVLAVFNIVPGYPLDGGRLLRSILWQATGDPHKSTRWAARVGQGFAVVFMAATLVGLAGGNFSWAPAVVRTVLQYLSGGLFSLLIGVFLFQGATAAYKRAALREQINHATIRDVMGSVPPALDPSWSLARALQVMQERPSLLWPVGDPVTATLVLEQIDDVSSDRWGATTVRELATPAEGVTMDVDAPLDQAVECMIQASHNMVIVTEAGRAIGLLTPSLISDIHH